MTRAQRWQRVLLIPCAALTAASLHAGSGQAESRRHGQPDQRPRLTQTQQQALFKVRRDWELRSYPQRLALLKNEQRCVKDADTADAYRHCKRQQHQARRALHEQGREQLNAERKRLGLPLRPEWQGRHLHRGWKGAS